MVGQRGSGSLFGGARIAVVGSGILLAVILALAGCSVASPKSSPAPATSGVPGAVPTSTSTPVPAYDPTGNASANLAYFVAIGHAKFSDHPDITGRTIVDDLVAAGFDKKAMEITPDKTSIGLQAWNIEFSVKLNGTCLIGQAGNVSFHAFATTVLASGHCLIGKTRKIDW